MFKERSRVALLEMRGIKKRFGGVDALKGVDFTLGAGEVHALVGENGAGKSTLMKVLSGALGPDAGTIQLEGMLLRVHSVAEAQREGIVMVYQELNLVPDLTVAENLALGRLPGLVRYRTLDTGARVLLAQMGLRIAPERRVRSLSAGEQQRWRCACGGGRSSPSSRRRWAGSPWRRRPSWRRGECAGTDGIHPGSAEARDRRQM